MATVCRSAAVAAVRSAALRSKTLLPKPTPSKRAAPLASRSVAPPALGTVESLMPLHSAIAAARLKSSIGIDSSCWTCLSQGDHSVEKLKYPSIVYICVAFSVAALFSIYIL